MCVCVCIYIYIFRLKLCDSIMTIKYHFSNMKSKALILISPTLSNMSPGCDHNKPSMMLFIHANIWTCQLSRYGFDCPLFSLLFT